MSNLKTQKRIAAEILKLGKSRVWINPEAGADVGQAMTRDDVREIVKQGLIQEKPAKKQTRKRAKKRMELRRKRKATGHGKRRGTRNARKPEKVRWMEKIRSQRRFLRKLRDEGRIDVRIYRRYYLRIKGGEYTTIKQLRESMKTEGVLKQNG